MVLDISQLAQRTQAKVEKHRSEVYEGLTRYVDSLGLKERTIISGFKTNEDETLVIGVTYDRVHVSTLGGEKDILYSSGTLDQIIGWIEDFVTSVCQDTLSSELPPLENECVLDELIPCVEIRDGEGHSIRVELERIPRLIDLLRKCLESR